MAGNRRSIVTIGMFDGVHLGHRAILAEARHRAAEAGVTVTAVTFDQHPQAVLRPGSEPPRLLATPDKVRRLRDAGAQEVIVHDPSPELLTLAAEAFIAQIVEDHRPLAIVEGVDFRFGRGRRGDTPLLRELGERHGFEAVIIPKVEVPLHNHQLVTVSSSLCRWLVGHGRVADAARCLGEAFSLTARVAAGDRRGRTIGVPTANLEPADYAGYILPADGVYAGVATLATGETFNAAISVGPKPTFAGRTLTVEAHLLDYTAPDPDALYDEPITLSFTRWLRDQYPFPSLEALKAQIARDLDATRKSATIAASEPRRDRSPSSIPR
jgi:riboflavin kinase/FMN adenylyltransferase